MPARGFYFDDTSDADRLVREWLQSAPPAWTQAYSSPYQCYKHTAAGGVHYMVLMSQPPVNKCEVNVTMKTNNADAMMGVVLRRPRSVIEETGMFYLWCTGGIFGLVFVDAAGATPVLFSLAYVVDPTKWHHIRAQVDGRMVKAKIWPNDTAEPDWMIVHRIRYREILPAGVIGFMGTVRTVYYTDIRWTPIGRV